MLENLDTIDWSHLSHAYGSASDVPANIKALASPFLEIWEHGLEEIRGSLLHQGTVYEATVFAIPFFIELLEQEKVRCRAEILYELAYAYGAGSYLWDIKQQVHQAIVQGLPTYLRLLEDPDPKVRMYALYTLVGLEKEAPEIGSLLLTRFSQESDPQVRACIFLFFTFRTDALTGADLLLEQILQKEEEHPLVKVLAALKQIQGAGRETPQTTVLLLVDALTHANLLQDQYRELPWLRNSGLTLDISRAVLLLASDVADLLVPALLERFTSLEQAYQYRKAHPPTDDPLDPFDLELFGKQIYQIRLLTWEDTALPTLIHALLYLVFEGKPFPVEARPWFLTETQRSVLFTVLSSEIAEYYSRETNTLLESFNLPPLSKLREFLL